MNEETILSGRVSIISAITVMHNTLNAKIAVKYQ